MSNLPATVDKKKKKKEKQKWPFVKYLKDRDRWQVDARTKEGGDRLSFDTKEEADGFAEKQRIRRKNEGIGAFNDKELAEYGWSITDAIRFALAHLRTKQKSALVSVAVKEMIASKETAGRGEDYCKVMGWNLGKLSRFFPTQTISEIKKSDLDRFLFSLRKGPGAIEPSTVNTIRRDCITLWTHCVSEGYASVNIADLSEIATVTPDEPGILTPEQAAKLLECSDAQDLRAFVAIGLFAGLRVHEIKKLDWSDIRIGQGVIRVRAATDTKRKTPRALTMQPNLKAILTPLVKESGKVVDPINFRRRWLAVRVAAGLGDWESDGKRNCMRHSYVSYRVAVTTDRGIVAAESGHSPKVLGSTYLSLVDPTPADIYWSIGLPPRGKARRTPKDRQKLKKP